METLHKDRPNNDKPPSLTNPTPNPNSDPNLNPNPNLIPSTKPNSSFEFEELYLDLLMVVVSNLDLGTLYSMSLVSKSYHSLLSRLKPRDFKEALTNDIGRFSSFALIQFIW